MALPAFSMSAHADNSWNVFLNPYEGIEKDELFRPLELPISSGDTVTWINHDSTSHKIVSGVPGHPDFSGEFFSIPVLSPGKSYSVSLEPHGYAGYYYFCEIHPWFTGKLFFEDRPDIFQSTLDISYEIDNSGMLFVSGMVESDLGNTGYEIVIYDSKGNLVFQGLYSFEPDSSFDISVDTSSSIWDHDENYVLKLIYGVPSESTNIAIVMPAPVIDDNLKINSLKFCQDSESDSDFVFEGVLVPGWYKKPLCWFGDGLIVQNEVLDSLDFFRQLS